MIVKNGIHMMAKSWRAVAVSAVLAWLLGCIAITDSASPDLAVMPSWRDGAPAKMELLKYVATATDKSSSGYIPPDERIAVFDFDGTLFCETAPTYFDWALFEHRVLDDASYTPTETQASVARKARETGVWPGLSFERERMMAEAWRGFTPDAFAEYVRAFAAEPQPGFAGMNRGEAFYRPMVEVVRFLVDNGFCVYVCSGTDRFMMRPVVEDGLSLPPRQIIGSDSAIAARLQDGRDGLEYIYDRDDEIVLDGVSLVKNLQMNKVVAIEREIGAHPVLAFGNSMSDASMLNHALQNGRRRALAFMLLCDDMSREYGNALRARKMQSACGKYGWIPVSMRDDWKTIYGPGVTRDPAPFAHMRR